jgi:hypothetical protein
MSRAYAIESTPTLLGAKADHRLPMRRQRGMAEHRIDARPTAMTAPGISSEPHRRRSTVSIHV